MTDRPDDRPRRVATYELERCLGRGGFASVWAAHDVGSGDQVALKLLSGTDLDTGRRFEGEVSRLRRMAHPGLPRLIDAGREGGILFLAMELVDGRQLDTVSAGRLAASRGRRDRPGGFKVLEVLALLDVLSDVLAHCHALGIIHRDIKPGNILLLADGSPVLVDFGLGLSDDATRVTRAGSIVGTLKYMSPEQLEGDGTVDARSDLFQLAMVGYELLTGVPALPVPADVPSLGERFRRPVAAPSSLNPDVPEELDRLLLSSLSADPERRPSSAKVVRDTVRELRARIRDLPRRVASGPSSEGPGSFTSAARAMRVVVPVLLMVALGLALLWSVRIPSSNRVVLNLVPRSPTIPPAAQDPSPPPSSVIAPVTNAAGMIIDRLGPGRVKLEMMRIPGGCVRIGTPPEAKVLEMLSECPAHLVCVKPFYLGKYEVTQAQYRAVTGVNPSVQRGPDIPVQIVSPADADLYVARLRRLTGRPYRLPSEAEWEYACRAGSEAIHPWGDSADRSVLYAWSSRNAGERCHEVGTLKPNAFGVHDMLGNVAEWVADSKHDGYTGAPSDGRPWIDPGARAFIARGGAADMDLSACRSGLRFSPLIMLEYVGFRVAF